MNFSYNWLAELVEGLNVGPSELAGLISIKTAESEGAHEWAPWLNSVVAARVEQVAAIEGSKNVLASIETGKLGRKNVVCGAPNCRPGVITAYVPSGTNLPGGKQIRKVTIAGVESDGMLASGAELGVNRETAGIIELDGLEPGAAIGPSPDWLIEIDNKSLTHRPDLWGHHGMAREIAAITRCSLRDPVDLSLLPCESKGGIEVRIDDFELCPRYSALVLENVTVQSSPLWLQARLEAIGLNPINNVVDVTNYVMAEIAQPMHAFDADKLKGGIVVRRAASGERIMALNNEEYELQASNLVIADQESAIAVAGVIGGLYSAIGPETNRIVLESANFHAGNVRKTSGHLKLRTDASMRFEKAQDPENTVRGLARAVALLQQVSPGIRIFGGVVDVRREPQRREPIALPLDWLDRKLGRHVEPAEVKSILEALELGVTEAEPGVLSVTVPSWRATKDISIKDDLVEEIGRMIGYASIPPQAPLLPASVPPANVTRKYHHEVRSLLTAIGFDEVYNYSFVNEKVIARFGLEEPDHVRVLNPIAADQTHLRTTLIPGICQNIADNARYLDDFRFFEIGVEIHKNSNRGDLPVEVNHLCLAQYSKHGDSTALFQLKAVLQAVAPSAIVRPAAEARVFEHPARTANVLLDGQAIGRLFEFHPDFVERGRAVVLDLDLDQLQKAVTATDTRYTPLRRFPSSSFDLSVVVAQRTLSGDIQTKLRESAGPELEAIEWVREYSGPPLPDGTKSVSYRLTVGATDRTLSSEDITAIRQRIISTMQTAGFELRV